MAVSVSTDYVYQGECFDETSGKRLDRAEVEKARMEEIAYFKQMGVCEKGPYPGSVDAMGKKPIGVTWVDVWKTCGKHRSRLIAKELYNRDGPEVYAPPPARRGEYPIRDGSGCRGRGKARRGDDAIMTHIDMHRAC